MLELSGNRLSVDLLGELIGIPRTQLEHYYKRDADGVASPSSEMSPATPNSPPCTWGKQGETSGEDQDAGPGGQLASGLHNPQMQALQQLLPTLPPAAQKTILNKVLAQVQQLAKHGMTEQGTGVELGDARLLPAAANGPRVQVGDPRPGRSTAASLGPGLPVAANTERSPALPHSHADPIDMPWEPQPDIWHTCHSLPPSAAEDSQEQHAQGPKRPIKPRAETPTAGSMAAGQEAYCAGASQAAAHQARTPGWIKDVLQEGWGEVPATSTAVEDNWGSSPGTRPPLFDHPRGSKKEWQSLCEEEGRHCELCDAYPSSCVEKEIHMQGRQRTQNPNEAKHTRARPQALQNAWLQNLQPDFERGTQCNVSSCWTDIESYLEGRQHGQNQKEAKQARTRPEVQQNGWQQDLQVGIESSPAGVRNRINKATSDEDRSCCNTFGNSKDGSGEMAHVRPAALLPQWTANPPQRQVDNFAKAAGCAPKPLFPHVHAAAPPPSQSRPIPLPAGVQEALDRLMQLDPGLDLDLEVLSVLQRLSRSSEDLALLALMDLEERDTPRLNNPSAYLMRIIGNIRLGRSGASGGAPYCWPDHMTSWKKHVQPPQSPRGRCPPREDTPAEKPWPPPPLPPQQDSDSEESWEIDDESTVEWALEYKLVTLKHGRISPGRAAGRVGKGFSGKGAAKEAGVRQMKLNPKCSSEQNRSVGSSSSDTSEGTGQGRAQNGTALPAAYHAPFQRPIRSAAPNGLPLQQANGWSLGPAGGSSLQSAWIEPAQAAANDWRSPAASPAAGAGQLPAARRKTRRAAVGRSNKTAAGGQLPSRLSKCSSGHWSSGSSGCAGTISGSRNGRMSQVSAQDEYEENPIFAAKDNPDLCWRAEKKTPAPKESEQGPATALKAYRKSTTNAGYHTGSQNGGLTAPASALVAQPAPAAGRQIIRPMLSPEIDAISGGPGVSESLKTEKELSLDTMLLEPDAIMDAQQRQIGPSAAKMILDVDTLYMSPPAGPPTQGGPARSMLPPKYQPFHNAIP